MSIEGRRQSIRVVRSPTGPEISARSWLTEAPLRMLMNNLDPDVAERPGELVVYGGLGRAARDWECFDRIVETLRDLEEDETLLVQSGKPVGVFRTHTDAPRVLIANSNLVPHWAHWEHFNALDRQGLMMYGQMTAGSWIYIGSQGIIQGTYETFVSVARRHYEGSLAGRWILTAGLGGMGAAQPLAATMAGASLLAVECDPGRIRRRLETGYLDESSDDLDHALSRIEAACRDGRPVSVGLLGNAAEVYPELVTARSPARRGDRSDFRPRSPERLPAGGLDPGARGGGEGAGAGVCGVGGPEIDGGSGAGDARLSRPWGCPRSTTATTSVRPRSRRASTTPSTIPASCPPTSVRSSASARAPSGGRRSPGIPRTSTARTRRSRRCSRTTPHLHNWLDMARERIRFQGLPCRICWLGLGERARVGLAFNEMVASGELRAPIVIGRDHLDSGSVASPNRETEGMRDGSGRGLGLAAAQRAASTARAAATWVSLHHGGGVGIGFSQHAGMVVVWRRQRGGRRGASSGCSPTIRRAA